MSIQPSKHQVSHPISNEDTTYQGSHHSLSIKKYTTNCLFFSGFMVDHQHSMGNLWHNGKNTNLGVG